MVGTHEIKCREFRPLQDVLLLASPPKGEDRPGELHVPDNPRDYVNCEVLAAGPKCELKAGDIVYQQRFAAPGEMKLTVNGRACFLQRERHTNVILAQPTR